MINGCMFVVNAEPANADSAQTVYALLHIHYYLCVVSQAFLDASILSRYFSASSAAMQPVPADVMA